MRKQLKKRCDRCGIVADVPSKRRRCHQRRFGQNSYSCWGNLRVVKEPTLVSLPKQPAAAAPKLRPQDIAQKKLDQARKKVSEKTSAMARLAKQLRAWERKATYYARRASLTDVELAADKLRRETARANRPKRRSIRLPESA